MNALRAWWHRAILFHPQTDKMNDGLGPASVTCFCKGMFQEPTVWEFP